MEKHLIGIYIIQWYNSEEQINVTLLGITVQAIYNYLIVLHNFCITMLI